jgi:hypothetical protein
MNISKAKKHVSNHFYLAIILTLAVLLPHYSARADNPPPGTVGYPATTPTPGGAASNKSLTTASLTSATSPLNKFNTWNLKGGYVAAGVGMRNRGYGTINIAVPSGSSVKAAYLYWDILGNAQDISFTQGQLNGTPIVGTLIGQSADACWGNSANFAYRADVTPWVAGSGSYALSGFRSGTTTGSDPFISGSTAPMLEGASLVVMYENPDSSSTQVLLYDGSFETSSATGTLTMDGFTAPNPMTKAQTTFIGADGQANGSEVTAFNASPLSITWDGADPQAGPRYQYGNLWDTLTVDVTSRVTPGSTSGTASLQSTGDCLVWVAQAFSIQEAQSTQTFLCTDPDYLVQVVNAQPQPNPGTTTEADTMLAVISPSGIYLHSGPTINAKKMGVIPWGSTVSVIERITFPHTGQPDDIWYYVSLNTISGWIPARMSESYPTPNTYLYIVNATQDNDPCAGNRPQPARLTFEYDRETAASYAIAQSYANDGREDLLQRVSTYLNSQTPFLNSQTPFAAFIYSELAPDNGAGASGSAMFLSEAIWMGGMPMTVGAGVNCTYDSIPQGRDGGWQYCPFYAGGSKTSSRVWRNHPGVIGYFTLGDPFVATISGRWAQTNTVLDPDSKGTLAGVLVSQGKGGGDDVAKFVNLKNGNIKHDQKAFSEWINSSLTKNNTSIQAGDYVWINSGSYDSQSKSMKPALHGLLVAGWGPIVDCSSAVSRTDYVLLSATNSQPIPTSANQLVPRQPAQSYYYVPYVVDFSGVKGHQIQHNAPRPFYCTEFQNPNYFGVFPTKLSGEGATTQLRDIVNEFKQDKDGNTIVDVRLWYFFHLPERVTISPPDVPSPTHDQLYVADTWEWNAVGNLCPNPIDPNKVCN